MAYCLVWSFEVAPQHRPEFERIYAGDGDWAKLFAQGDGFLGTELLTDAETPGRYVTVDRWRTADDFAAFKRERAESYGALDVECEDLTAVETRLGAFTCP
ncbi:MAG: antibiotic biosynthesis monooxygenase [Asticcacaulis sp.]